MVVGSSVLAIFLFCVKSCVECVGGGFQWSWVFENDFHEIVKVFWPGFGVLASVEIGCDFGFC